MHKFAWFCKNEQDGEDVVQDAYERAMKYYDDTNPPLNFEHWFARILYTAMLDHKRKAFGQSLENEEDQYEGIPCQQYDGELVKQIYDFIETKPEDIRYSLYLHFKYGYSAVDIHNIVGGPYIATAKRISRFREELKERFGE
jgi:RNA polymerase sigma factor (sigma-70 family)